MLSEKSTQYVEFKKQAAAYLELWKQADAEKRKSGKISRKTRKALIELEKLLNA